MRDFGVTVIPMPQDPDPAAVAGWEREAALASAKGHVFLFCYFGSRKIIEPNDYVQHRSENDRCRQMGLQQLGHYELTTREAERLHWMEIAERAMKLAAEI